MFIYLLALENRKNHFLIVLQLTQSTCREKLYGLLQMFKLDDREEMRKLIYMITSLILNEESTKVDNSIGDK